MNNTTRNIIRSSSRSNNKNNCEYNPFVDKRNKLYRKCIATHIEECIGYDAQRTGQSYFNVNVCRECPQNRFINCDGYVSELDPDNPRYNLDDVVYYERNLADGEFDKNRINTLKNGKRKNMHNRTNKELKKKESSEHFALGFLAFCICIAVNNSTKALISVYLCCFLEFAFSIFVYLKANTESHKTNIALKKIAFGVALGVVLFIFAYIIP